MSDFIQNLTKSSFWLSVVLVGVLINFASSWLQVGFGKLSHRYTRSRLVKTEKEARYYAVLLERAIKSDRDFDLALHRSRMAAAAADRYLLLGVLAVVMFGAQSVIGLMGGIQTSSHPSQFSMWSLVAMYAFDVVLLYMSLGQARKLLITSKRHSEIANSAARAANIQRNRRDAFRR
ncbi:hypothetical protein [Ralstonia sp. Ralssp110]|uniref:hypothetical protein n=1 Tax=Ralstonia sp. Ralssp110 TaxID=3243004 RepID=UPI0039B527AF